MRTTDNNWGNYEVKAHEIADCGLIGNKNLNDLLLANPNLLIFPLKVGQHHDEIEKSEIFSLKGNKLTTYNMMGFVGVNNTQITICSRFQKNDSENDNFLHYMLQKVFALNIVDLKSGTDPDSIWDIFLLYLFPYYLNKALSQGLYKEYQNKNFNDSNVKGVIDVSRHIRVNNPFVGKIAYKTREHTYDNRVTELIRHTIEYINRHELNNGILTNEYTTRGSVIQILNATPLYNKIDRRKIIEQNRKIVNHSYYSEYEILRRICLQILRKEGLTFGSEENKVYGLLFDGAWLWEEYLNTILSPIGFIHPENKKGINPIFLFKNEKYARYPDFYHKMKNTVLDAKYKNLGGAYSELERNDIHQIISYIHVLKAKIGGFVYPFLKDEKSQIGILNGYEGEVFKYGLKIPTDQKNYVGFKLGMLESESSLVELCSLI